LANLTVSLSLATATGTTDKAAVTLVDGVNTDPVFNFNLVTPATEQLTITDNDTESNSVYLSGVSSYAGAASSITLVNGAAGKYLNLDTYAGNSAAAAAGRGGYGFATDGSAGDNTTALTTVDANNGVPLTVAAGTARIDSALTTVGAKVFTPTAAAVGDRIIAENLDGSKYVGDIIARFGDITRADGVSSQSIVGGTGNDTFIFDGITNENGGYTAADTVKGGAGTDTLIIDGDTTLLAGTPRITTNTSEWDNTTGIDVLRFARNEGVANVGNNAFVTVTGGGYYAHIDNDFISQTDAGNRLTVINNDGDRATNTESDLVLDLTGLSQLKFVTYVGANGNGQAGHASTRIIVDDISSNQNMILNGGDISGAKNANATDVTLGNNNVYNVLNTANVSISDLSQTSNFGRLEFTNNQAVVQTLNLTLNNQIVEQLVDSSNTASAAQSESLAIVAVDNGTVGSALNVDARSVTGFHGLNITGSVNASDIIRLDANIGGTVDNIDLGASAGDRINWTGTATTVAISTVGNTSTFTNATGTITHVTTGVEYVDISGLTYTSSTLTGSGAANETLVGGAGTDVISGGAGADVMTGNAGNDTFVITSRATTQNGAFLPGNSTVANIDQITDFVGNGAAAGDTIQLGLTANAFGGAITFTGATTATVTAVTVATAADFTALTAAVQAASAGVASTNAVAQVYDITVSAGALAGRYVIVNDDTAAIAATDTIISITGVTGALHTSDFTFA
ncbi:beta strand repeat-containing protein, partial [Undibacterium sp. SXout7W]|uniref:beta strand repeat-containing protein n=1 Tax=Undibacterium sp. SXout7W TaxID=3413049 RepID=UPI003BF42DF7